MAKGSRGRRRIASRQCRTTPYPMLCNHDSKEDRCPKKCPKGLDKKDWKDATCSVCMECPHNAVLLLCSSHDKGCRPYMCGTSLRYSNCLDQYKKAYTKVISPNDRVSSHGSVPDSLELPDSSLPAEKCEAAKLACPLCRGEVKGWTVVEPVREFLNLKNRSCMQENCPFSGNYKELRKHVKAEHPSARPHEIDPTLERKWRRLEHERERDDVISTIRSTTPGAMVLGDYVVEGNNHGLDTADRNLMNVFLLLQSFGQLGNIDFRQLRQPGRASNHGAVGSRHTSLVADIDSSDDDDRDNDIANGSSMSLANRLRRHGRVLLGRSGRRRRRRQSNGGRR